MNDYIEIFRGNDRLYYWRWKAANHEIIAQSEGYTRRSSAKRAAMRVAPGRWMTIIPPTS